MNVLIISCSLNPDSRSRVLALDAQRLLHEAHVETRFVDLRDHPIALCDGEACDPRASALADDIRKADAILLAVPIYNYDVNAAAKNLVEQTGKAWEGKIVGFLCAAGGHGSYMSVMSLANSLMLDFRCVIVPRFVYATGDAYDADGSIASEKIRGRVDQLCRETARLARALATAGA